MTITFRYAASSDTGRVRTKNDDSAYTGRYLAVVADGMGGHVGGNVASASTVLDLTPLDHAGYGGSAGTYLADEIQTANIILNQLVELNPLLAGMGTTCTALLIDGEEIELAHIGDSRAYRLRDGVFEQMTTDHTFVQRLVEEGRIRAEEAESHPHKNVVMRVLGDTDASPELELKRIDAKVGDRWLLCSDGLSGVVSNQLIQDALTDEDDLEKICRDLVNVTLDRGAPDNVTVAVLEIQEDPDSTTPTTSRFDALPGGETPSNREESATRPSSPWATAEEDTAEGSEAELSENQPQHRVAPWRRRLPRAKDEKIRHTLRHGAWRGDSFSDGVLNAMTQRSGMDLEDVKDQEESSASVLRNELNERPHVLVGAAESATQTGAIPTVTDSTVQRRATLAKASPADPEDEDELPEGLLEDEGTAPRKKRWGLTWFITAFVLVLIVGLAWASLAWVNNQYYVGESDGYVTIYRGVDQSLGPIHLDNLEERSEVKVDSLPDFDQDRVSKGITASSRDEAERIVKDLTAEAQAHTSQPQEGEPSGTPRPTGTVSTAPDHPSSSGSASSGGDDR